MPHDADPEAVAQLAAEIERLRAEIAALRTLESDFEIEGRLVHEDVSGDTDHRRIVARIEAADGLWRVEQVERRVGETGWWVRSTFWKVGAGGDAR